MNDIAQRIHDIKANLPGNVELVAVSKFHPKEAIMEAYEGGHRVFGESRANELVEKARSLPDDIEWHFIGHLQTNKVRQLIALRPALIESVDSERLLRAIDAESERAGIVSRVLMQVHVAQEETKFGLTPDEMLAFFTSRAYESLRATHICGLMAMASNTDDMTRVAADFARVAALKTEIQQACPDLRGFDALSMGMSHDYPLAIAAGATLVRVGSAIFGDRSY